MARNTCMHKHIQTAFSAERLSIHWIFSKFMCYLYNVEQYDKHVKCFHTHTNTKKRTNKRIDKCRSIWCCWCAKSTNRDWKKKRRESDIKYVHKCYKISRMFSLFRWKSPWKMIFVIQALFGIPLYWKLKTLEKCEWYLENVKIKSHISFILNFGHWMFYLCWNWNIILSIPCVLNQFNPIKKIHTHTHKPIARVVQSISFVFISI